MNLSLTGSAAQRSWVDETLARSGFPWDQITTSLLVQFDEPTDENEHDGLTTFAWTDLLYTLTDTCGRADAGFMTLRPDLDTFVHDFGIPDKRHPDSPLHTAMDVVHHELGHVVASKIDPSDVPVIAACFGRNIAGWGDDHNLPWNERVIEAFAETFKDFYLGEHRQWDNRTNLRLRFAQRDQFLDVLDRVCPCWGSDPDAFDGAWFWDDTGAGGAFNFYGTRPAEGAVTLSELDMNSPDYFEHADDLIPVQGGDTIYYEWDLPSLSLFEPFPLRFEVVEGGNLLFWHEFTPKTRAGWYSKLIPGGSVGVRFYSDVAVTNGRLKMWRLLPDARAACDPKSRPPWPYGGDPSPDPPPPPYQPPAPVIAARLSSPRGGVRRYNRKRVV